MFCRSGTLKNFIMLSCFLIKFQVFWSAISFKRDCNIGAFLWNLQNLYDYLFYKTFPVAASGNILWTLSLLHMTMMNRVFAWYAFALQHLFHFIACILFLSVSFFFSYFFVDFFTYLGIELFLDSQMEFRGMSCCSLTPANICWPSRRLEDVFKTYLEDVFNTFSA